MNKPHPADIADRAKVTTATHFNVHLRRGPEFTINEEAPTLDEAIVIADRITTEHKGKSPMIYAITPEKITAFVPLTMIAEARNAAE